MRHLTHTGILLIIITSAVGSFSELSENSCDCKERLFKHYGAKGCQIAQLNSCGCPTRFICPNLSDTYEEAKTCTYQNQEYKLGSRINVTDKCQSCRCLGGDHPHIVCRHKECPQLDSVEEGNCHLVYEEDKCCPIKYECVARNENNEAIDGSVCIYNGISYPFGARIYPSEDPCLVCVCSENWQGPSNSSCYQQECLFEKNKMLFNQGCIPIYHEKKCCPIEFYCPTNHEIRTNNLPLENELIAPNIMEDELIAPNIDSTEGTCVFDGKVYEVGEELKMKNPCVQCICSVPPDFTCLHQSCPPVPSIENCEVVVTTNSCCPSYECFSDEATSANSSGIICPTPVCNDASCEIKIPEGHDCPTCICDESIVREKNSFEKEENVLEEGSLNTKNISDSKEIEKEDADEEILIPIRNEFSPQNVSKSETEELELEGENNETLINDKDFSREELDLSLKKVQDSNTSVGERDLIRILRKRSTNNHYNYDAQQQQNHLPYNQYQQQPQYQQQFSEEYDMDSNLEREDSNEGYDDLRLSRKSEESEEKPLNREDLFGSASFRVPAGCPTPICANSSCKIEIPVGHHCPTCVCKRREVGHPR